MSFLKKIFNIPEKEIQENEKQKVNLSLDDLFVHNFIEKGGKFLYCLKEEEVISNFKNIFSENKWEEILVLNKGLETFYTNLKEKTFNNFNSKTPVLTTCEHLIANNGEILFSSSQLKSKKLSELPESFVVFATTSQLVKNKGEGLTGIKFNYKGNLPTNISSIRNYTIHINDDNFLNYGNSNSKNLYLLLLENL
jgi:L-lactate utilization protein LutC